MIRLIVEKLLLFLLPTLLYLTYRYFIWRSRERDSEGQEYRQSLQRDISDAPLIWLFVAGAVLVFATLIAFGDSDGGKPGQKYYPPVVRDGKIIPGHFK